MYDADALKIGIERAKENIKIFEVAIEKEWQMIIEYRQMIAVLEAKRDVHTDVRLSE